MTTSARVGLSFQKDAQRAGSEAATQAIDGLGGLANLLIAFTTARYDPETAVHAMRSAAGEVPLISCFASGIITPHGLSPEAVAVMALRSDDLRITVVAEAGHAAPDGAGQTIAETLARHPAATGMENEYMAVVALVNLSNCDPSQAVENAVNVLGPMCPLVGGVSGANVALCAGPESQSIEISQQLQSNSVVAALLRSPVPIGVGVVHGFKPVGRPLVVTRSVGNVVYELNGQPAVEAYQQVREDELSGADSPQLRTSPMYHPLGLPQIGGEYLVRDAVRARPDGAIEFAAPIPENAVVNMMSGEREGIIAAARAAARQAVNGLAGRPAAAILIFDCLSRLDMLGDAAATEIDQIRNVVGNATPFIGFYSSGEIAPKSGWGLAALHNKTVAVCALAQG